MVEATEDSACPSCGYDQVAVLGPLPDSFWFAGKALEQPLAGGSLYRCRQCHLLFRFPLVEAVANGQLYDNQTSETWSFGELRNDHKLIREYVRQHIPTGGRVLDFGCYTGELLGRLGDGYQKFGLEINQTAARLASKHTDQPVFRQLSDIPSGLRFDAILAADVIEHLEDPSRLLADLSDVLAPGGKLLITTGDAAAALWQRFGANWWYCFYPEHVSFLSQAWLNYAAPQLGLRIELCQPFRYSNLGPARRFFDQLQTHIYGRFPTAYLRCAKAVRAFLRKPALASVPGSGVSQDHLFIVLAGQESIR